MGMDDSAGVGEDGVRALAGLAGLPLERDRAATLARMLEADLRAIRELRAIDAGETYPLGPSPLASEQAVAP